MNRALNRSTVRSTRVRSRALAPSLVSSLVFGGLLLAASASAQVVIDPWSPDQGPLTSGGTTTSDVDDAGILGGERELQVIGAAVTAEVTSGTLTASTAAGGFNLAIVTWDGAVATGSFDPEGLGGVDLTNGGADDALELTLDAVSGSVLLGINVSTDAERSSFFSRLLPETTDGRRLVIPFDSFVVAPGGRPADFTNVGAVSLVLQFPGVASVALGGPFQTTADEPVLSVTKVDLDGFSAEGGEEIGDEFVEPGDTITYQINIENTGGQASSIEVSDALEANLAQVLPEDVRTTPIVFPDLYLDACGNTTLEVDDAGAGFEPLLANDFDPDGDTLTIVSIGSTPIGDGSGPFTTAQGGEVTNVDPATGTFDYDPPVGTTGADTFFYTVTDDDGNERTAQVTIQLEDLVWFVDHDHPGPYLGTQQNPFQDFAALDGAGGVGDVDEPDHTIFVKDDGAGPYDDLELEEGQVLLGEQAGLSICVRTPIVDDGTGDGRPDLTSATGPGLTLAADNTVRHIVVDDVPLDQASITSTGPVGTALLRNVGITGTGRALALVGGGTLDATFTQIVSEDSIGVVVDLQNLAGGLVVEDASESIDTSIQSATGLGIRIAGADPTAVFDFGDTSIATSAGGVDKGATSTVDFETLQVTSGGIGVQSTGGVFRVVDADSSIVATGSPAGSIADTDLGAGWTFDTITGTGASASALTLERLDDPIVVTNPASLLSSSDGSGALDLDGGTADVTFPGTVTQLGAAGPAVSSVNRSGGVVTLSGPVNASSGGGGFSAVGNAGASFVLSGGFDVTGATSRGFEARNGGTFVVDSSGVTTRITGTGAPVWMEGVTIGAAGVTFDQIDSDTAAGGAIEIDTVSGGVFTTTTATIDDPTSFGVQMRLSSASVVFGTLVVDDTGGDGVELTGNSGSFTVAGGSIGETTGSGTTTAGVGVDIDGGTGTVAIGAAVTNTADRIARVRNRTGGTVTLSGALDETAQGLEVSGNTGGTVTFSNASKVFDTGTLDALTLASNTGASVVFSGGGLDLDTTSGTALLATGGGTLEVSGDDNSVDTTTGTAVRIENTTLGENDVTFESITSTGASSNPAIALLATGDVGDFRVTGVGSIDETGGTIANKTNDAITADTVGGIIRFRNLLIEDIGSTAGGFDTRSGHDAIHVDQLTGSLILDGVIIRRISDNAIHGADLGDEFSASRIDEVIIRDSLIEDTNRFHVAGVADDVDEGSVRIVGLRERLEVRDSTIQRGGELLDIFSDTTGNLDFIVTESILRDAYQEYTSGSVARKGKMCVDLTMEGEANVEVEIGDAASAISGNIFTNCGLASLRLGFDSGASGTMTGLIGRNDFVVTDHSSTLGTSGNFPQGGVALLSRGSGHTVDMRIVGNFFQEIQNADGGVGNIVLDMDEGDWEVVVEDNELNIPINAPYFVRATATTSAEVVFRNNTHNGGSFTSPDPGYGTFNTPGVRTLIDSQDGANLDIVFDNEDLAKHDTGFDPGNTIEIRSIAVGSAPDVCVAFIDSEAPDGYGFDEFAGSIILEQGVSAATGVCTNTGPCRTALQDNGNTGGGGAAGTVPPVVTVNGTPEVTGASCVRPSP